MDVVAEVLVLVVGVVVVLVLLVEVDVLEVVGVLDVDVDVLELLLVEEVELVVGVAARQSLGASWPIVDAPCSRLFLRVGLIVCGRPATASLNASVAREATAHRCASTADEILSRLLFRLLA